MYTELPYEKYIFDIQNQKESYISACEWLGELGINYKNSRYGKYLESMSVYEDMKDFLLRENTSDLKDKKDFFEFYNASAEAADLIRLHESFSSNKHKLFLDKMRKINSGNISRYVNIKDNSRDFLFELSIASRFIKAGYEVDITNIADVVVLLENRYLFIECKRIKSEKQLGKRSIHANKQIHKRLISLVSKQNRGMAALNLTDILVSKSKVLVGDSIEEIKIKCNSIIKDFVEDNLTKITKNVSKRSLGTLCECSFHAFLVSSDPKFVFFRSALIVPTSARSSDGLLIKTLAENIANQPPNYIT